MKTGVELIGAERERQLKRFSLEHDRDRNPDGVLGRVVRGLIVSYLGKVNYHPSGDLGEAEASASKLAARITNKYCSFGSAELLDSQRILAIAGALIAAELDRIGGLCGHESIKEAQEKHEREMEGATESQQGPSADEVERWNRRRHDIAAEFSLCLSARLVNWKNLAKLDSEAWDEIVAAGYGYADAFMRRNGD